jgi:hypothetical protein
MKRLTALIDVASALELGADRPIAHASPVQSPSQVYGLGALLGMRLAALALAVTLADAIAGEPQLGDQVGEGASGPEVFALAEKLVVRRAREIYAQDSQAA